MKKTSKVYKKLVRCMTFVYVFFSVIMKKPKYRNSLIGLLSGVILFIVLTIVLVKSISHNEDDNVKAEYETLKSEFVFESTDKGDKGKPHIKNNPPSKDDNSETAVSVVDEWADIDYKNESDEPDDLWYGKINVDFEGLKAVNSDIVGWIYFEAANISYPILYSGDNETYLRTSFDKKARTAGSIFLEGENNKYFTDKHSIIYGHNMNDKTMFGQLHLYKKDSEYYDNHQYFQLIYPDEASGKVVKERYHVFSCKEVDADDSIYYIFDENYDNLSEFAANVIKSGNLLTQTDDIKILNADKIITLSTCSGKTGRLVVSAVRCAVCVVEQ